jgi:PAS domain S-box-containing protein
MRADHATGHVNTIAGHAAANAAFDLDDIPDAVFVIDRSRRIEDSNAAAGALVGWAHDDLLGRSLDDILANHGELDGGHVRFMPSRAGVRARHRDGRDIPVEVWCCPNEHAKTVVVVRRTSAPDPEHVDDTLAQILRDLGPPLSRVAFDAALIDARCEGMDRDTVKVAMSRLAHNIDFIDRLVKDLSDALSAGSERFHLQRRPTELRSLVERAVERAVAATDRARVAVEAPNAMILTIDDSRIERVVANFVLNALEHAPPGSSIVVRIDRARDHGCVSVIDSGPRMSARELTYVLEKLGRTARARARGGSGLRLYISKVIVEAHGGRIGVEPGPSGDGSRFFFELPSN